MNLDKAVTNNTEQTGSVLENILKDIIRLFAADYSKRLKGDRLAAQKALKIRIVKLGDSGKVRPGWPRCLRRTKLV